MLGPVAEMVVVVVAVVVVDVAACGCDTVEDAGAMSLVAFVEG